VIGIPLREPEDKPVDVDALMNLKLKISLQITRRLIHGVFGADRIWTGGPDSPYNFSTAIYRLSHHGTSFAYNY
jgi:hypothetical protein